MTQDALRATIRDAVEADIPALTALKGAGSEDLHRDRLRDAQGAGFRYLALLVDATLIGAACLVIRRPAYWSDAADTEHLPQLVDLRVHAAWRGRGYGSWFVGALERIAADMGHRALYLSVEPRSNPRAYWLYERLGYRPLQAEPHLTAWSFVDSAGNLHAGEQWCVDMMKRL